MRLSRGFRSDYTEEPALLFWWKCSASYSLRLWQGTEMTYAFFFVFNVKADQPSLVRSVIPLIPSSTLFPREAQALRLDGRTVLGLLALRSPGLNAHHPSVRLSTVLTPPPANPDVFRRKTRSASPPAVSGSTSPQKGWSHFFAPAFRPRGEACARARLWVASHHFLWEKSVPTALMVAAMAAGAVPGRGFLLPRLGCSRLRLPGAAVPARSTALACRFSGELGFALD